MPTMRLVQGRAVYFIMFRLCVFFLALAGCGQLCLADTTRALNIFVSIPPQKYLLERIGRQHVAVSVMLRPGDAPETYDPTPGQLMTLAAAKFYFRIGVPFENVWIDSIRKGNDTIKIIDCCDNIFTSRSAELDNHVWTAPRNALAIASLIKKHLLIADPENRAEYIKNYQALVADLETLDTDIRAVLDRRRTPYFIVSHASLGYYAHDYDLIQLSLEKNKRELGAKSLARLLTIARRESIQTLFVQRQHYSPAADVFISELGAQVVEFDPLAEDYIVNLRRLTDLIAQAIN